MFFKRGRYGNNDAIMLLRYTLLFLLSILMPVTLFLTGFSWYASLQIKVTGNISLADLPLFLKNCLIFGIIGLMTFLIYFLVFMLVNFALKNVKYKWKKAILVLAIIGTTIIFLVFEIFSVIFIGYFYTWQLSLVLTCWPLLYVLVNVLLLINYFEFYNEQKNLNNDKIIRNEKEKELFFQDEPGTIF
ncbi:MAG: hypothetical protein ACRC8P_03465 [Spiroplasma sp.]